MTGLLGRLRLMLALVALLTLAALAGAQAETASDNAVNRVAQRMYCPVCENIPLDECLTSACQEWKEEIRMQLAAGRGDQDIINSFVARFGDHVVGVPQDPVLRALTFMLPLLATGAAIIVALKTLRSIAARRTMTAVARMANAGPKSDADYRKQLEADLRARR